MATGYGLYGRGSILVTDKFFFSFMAFRKALVPTQPLIQWVEIATSPEMKRPGREDNHTSILCRDQEWWSYTSTFPFIFTA
jgi:hypothetical protein